MTNIVHIVEKSRQRLELERESSNATYLHKEISIMDRSSGAQSEVITAGQDENMNQPDKIELETQIKT